MADYATVFAEVKKLSAEDQMKLAKEVAAQFKKPRAPKAQVEGAEPKPKRVLTEEQKAKMKAGREAAKARRDAEKAAAGGGEEPKPKAKRAPKAETAGEEKPKRVLTEEQKAKMKAGREAAKARREAEKAAAAAVKPEGGAAGGGGAVAEAEEVEEVVLVDWENDFGNGKKLYKRLNYEGSDYIYDYETRKYLGAYVKKTNKLKPNVADPLNPEED